MSTLVFTGFLSTPEDTEALSAAGARGVRAIDMLALTDAATRDEALARAAREVGEGDVLVGYSMGARVVLALLTDATVAARVSHALIISGSPGLASDDERAARAQTEDEWIQALCTDPRAFVDVWSETALFAPLLKTALGLRQLARRRALATDANDGQQWAAGWAHATRVLGQAASPPLWSALPHVRTPTWWATGALDARYGALAARAAALMPHAAHVVVDGSGHALLLEAPAALASILEEMSHSITQHAPSRALIDDGAHP
jgi:2-succinyl-6-hydroxy-2,4-cyclohexadiene-1-carboxylate synthase